MKKVIIAILSLIIIVGGYLIYKNNFSNSSLNNSASTSEEITKLVEENATSDITDSVDWSTYDTYNVDLNSGSTTISKRGIYNITGTLNNGSITIDTKDNVKLVLNNINITSSSGPAIYVKNSNNTYIELIGESNIKSNTNTELDAAIYSCDDLIIEGNGTLTVTSNIDGIASKDDLAILSGNINITSDDDGIRGKDSVQIKGGVIKINSSGDGIKSTNEEKGSIIIKDSDISIDSVGDGISSITTISISSGTLNIKTTSTSNNTSSKGLKAEGSISISGGVITISSTDDSIHSNGSISITGGEFSLTSKDDGIHADNTLVIDNGTINVLDSYEGLEASYITINGGTIKVKSDDDGINISGGNDSSNKKDMFAVSDGILLITGGELYVNSSGDGLDSNGNIKITSGTIYVDGPTNSGNGALDYNGTMEITGGTVIAVGASGMAQNASNSTQASVLINLSSSYSSSFKLGSIEYKPSKSYNSIMISSNKLTVGSSYDLEIDGNTVEKVSINNNVTNIGNSSMRGGPGNRGGMHR